METNFRPSNAAGQAGQYGYQPAQAPYGPPQYPPSAGPTQTQPAYGPPAYGAYGSYPAQSIPQQAPTATPAYPPQPAEPEPVVQPDPEPAIDMTNVPIGAPPPPKPQAFTGDLQPITGSTQLSRSAPVKFGVKLDSSPLRKLFRSKKFRRSLLALAVLGALGAGLLANSSANGLELRSLSNSAYTYQVAFYPEATIVKLDSGMNGLRYGNQAVLSVAPNPGPDLGGCSQIGPSWKEVVRVKYNGGEAPVCSATAINYVMYVSGEGERHLVSLTYGLERPKDIKPTLKRIFSSVRISR